MNVLFICTGNTCRSPMAEALFRKMVGTDQIEINSAGIAAINGDIASPHAQKVLLNKNIDHQHTSKSLTPSLVDWADLILTMTYSHKMMVLSRFSESTGKVYTLKEYVTDEQELDTDKLLNWDIADPFGGDYGIYEKTAEELEESLQKLHSKLKKREGYSR